MFFAQFSGIIDGWTGSYSGRAPFEELVGLFAAKSGTRIETAHRFCHYAQGTLTEEELRNKQGSLHGKFS
ncbi:MAG: hypothetical protein U1E20_02200 [Methylocystis sp.]|uniref:hypothetical protein n=1 Tax=Methylocystis sp. TaxID=1911079 RepID=UPI003937E31B